MTDRKPRYYLFVHKDDFEPLVQVGDLLKVRELTGDSWWPSRGTGTIVTLEPAEPTQSDPNPAMLPLDALSDDDLAVLAEHIRKLVAQRLADETERVRKVLEQEPVS